jgi:hypothetical protein
MPTQLIKKYLEEVARWLRNQQDYCDWTVGMEPIPHDKTWVKKGCNRDCESCECKIVTKDES